MPGPSWLSAWGRRGWRAQSLYGVSTWRWPSLAETSRNQVATDPWGDPGLALAVSTAGLDGSRTSYSRFGLTPWITDRPPRRQSTSIVSSVVLPAAKL